MKKIRMDMIFSHSSDVVSREIDGALIIVPLTSGVGDMEDDLFSMNETGTEIWNMLDGEKTVQEIVESLAQQYRTETGRRHYHGIGEKENACRSYRRVNISILPCRKTACPFPEKP